MRLVDCRQDHDLPPKWDGRPVEWELVTGSVWVCPPPKPDPCEGCGASHGRDLYAIGTVHPLPGDTFRDPVRKRTKSGATYTSGWCDIPAWPVIQLAAFRCASCLSDVVWWHSSDHDSWWDLDASDYRDEGSWPS